MKYDMMEIPLYHYRHLKRLADLRRCPIEEAVGFLFAHVDANAKDWISDSFGPTEETRLVRCGGRSLSHILERIQGLPRNIRPVTDGPYLDGFSFFSGAQGLIGIEAEGVRMLDFEKATGRDKAVYALVADLLPPMTHEQYRIYNTFNSQFLRLVRQPELFTMPRAQAPAIDAGCYVGYKALALARFVGGSDVLAFELAGDSFDVLGMNVRNNPAASVIPLQVALSDRKEEMVVNTRNEQSMAHSLTSFGRLDQAGASLKGGCPEKSTPGSVMTRLLDEFAVEFDMISAVHISVNGHEPEVCVGGLEVLRKSDIVRISCPYAREGRPIFDIVVDILQEGGVQVFGKSGGAVVAGRSLGDCHAVPLGC